MNNLIYLKSVSTLIEVLEKDNAIYIGSNKLENTYSNPFEDGFHNANWNRALKFKNKLVDDTKQNDYLTYYKLDMDLYLDLTNKDIVCLSKLPKNRFITELKEFKEEMIPLLIKNYNKHKIVNDLDLTWILNEYIDFEYVLHQPLNINRWIVNNEFEFNSKKYKWKVILVKSDHVGYELTKYGQIIYYYDNSLMTINDNNLSNDASLIDLDKGEFYVNGYYPLTPTKLLLNIKTKDLYEKDRIQDSIYKQFEHYFKDDELANLHMFNITNDINYLIDLVNEQYKDLNYGELLEQLNKDFKQMNMSYYVELFNNATIIESLNDKVDKNNEQEVKNFDTNINRFKK